MTKNPVLQFMIWAFLLSNPVIAQESIQIEIDSAPVDVEITKPPAPAKQPEPAPSKQVEKVEENKKVVEGEEAGYGMAIGIGALVAGALAALAGGGGSSGGGNSTPTHP